MPGGRRFLAARRGAGLLSALLPAAVLAFSAASWACVPGAVLVLSPDSGRAGDTVVVNGRTFNTDPTVPPVQVRFNGRQGPLLWEGRPDGQGELHFSFTVPNMAPDYDFLLATQEDASGRAMPGTPARAPFQLLGVAAEQPPATVAPAQPPRDDGTAPARSTVPVAPPTAAGPARTAPAGSPSRAPARRAVAPAAPAPARVGLLPAAPISHAAQPPPADAVAPSTPEAAPAQPEGGAWPLPAPTGYDGLTAGDQSPTSGASAPRPGAASQAWAHAYLGLALVLLCGATAVALRSTTRNPQRARAGR